MKRPVAVVPANRPNRILIVLAAAWMIAALAFGSVALEQRADSTGPAPITGNAQP